MRGSVNVPGKIGALFANHLKASNPHSVTKAQVGLGNVPNVGTNDQTPTYSAASSLATLSSGEKLSVSMGKIMKAITDLISHIGNKSNPHGVTAAQAGAVPTSRKVNNKALSADITLSASDVGAAAATDLTSHTGNTSNPHSVTKAQVGLGNVPNVATNDQTPTYSAASSLATLSSGEKLSVSMGKIMKAITDLISHIGNKSNPHSVTAAQAGAVPTSRKVNNKALSADITLSASDVGAAAASHGNHVPATQTANNATFLRNDNSWQKVSPANIGAATTATYTAAIDTSWTANSAGGYYKTVTVSGILATDNPVADVVLGDDVAANELYLAAWALVTRITTAANSITIYANGDAPTSAFTMQLKVVR